VRAEWLPKSISDSVSRVIVIPMAFFVVRLPIYRSKECKPGDNGPMHRGKCVLLFGKDLSGIAK